MEPLCARAAARSWRWQPTSSDALGPQADWSPLATIETLAPAGLLSWLAEPGLLTARVRDLCGERMRFRMLGPLREAELPTELRSRLGVDDGDGARFPEFGQFRRFLSRLR